MSENDIATVEEIMGQQPVGTPSVNRGGQYSARAATTESRVNDLISRMRGEGGRVFRLTCKAIESPEEQLSLATPSDGRSMGSCAQLMARTSAPTTA